MANITTTSISLLTILTVRGPDIKCCGRRKSELLTYDDNKLGVWAAYHRPDEYKSGKATGTEENALLH